MEMTSVGTNLASINFYEWTTPIVPWVPEGFLFCSKAAIASLRKKPLAHTVHQLANVSNSYQGH